MKFKVKVVVIMLMAVLFAATAAMANPAQAKQYLLQGHKFLKAKQYDKALQYYNYSIKLSPSADAYYYAGLANYMSGKKPEALSNAQQALKLNPSHAQAKALMAKAGGSGAAAAGGAGAAGGKGQKYLVMGHKYLKAKQYDMAIKYYNASAKVQPTYQAYQFLGTAYYKKGDTDKARAAYEKSLSLNPNNPQVKNILAKMGSGGETEPRISQQMGVHPLLLAGLFAGAIAVLFLF